MSRPPDTNVVVTHARLFTGTGEELIPDGAVWVQGRHVRRVGATDEHALETVAGTGRAQAPGGRQVARPARRVGHDRRRG